MKHLVWTLGKALALVAVGAVGVLATVGRRRKSDDLLVSVWSEQPGTSSVIAQTLVRKINGRWVNEGQGYTVEEVRAKE